MIPNIKRMLVFLVQTPRHLPSSTVTNSLRPVGPNKCVEKTFSDSKPYSLYLNLRPFFLTSNRYSCGQMSYTYSAVICVYGLTASAKTNKQTTSLWTGLAEYRRIFNLRGSRNCHDSDTIVGSRQLSVTLRKWSCKRQQRIWNTLRNSVRLSRGLHSQVSARRKGEKTNMAPIKRPFYFVRYALKYHFAYCRAPSMLYMNRFVR